MSVAPEQNDAWTAVKRNRKPRVEPVQHSPPTGITAAKTFVRRAAGAATMAARPYTNLPREDSEVIVRPHGGLCVARTPLPAVPRPRDYHWAKRQAMRSWPTESKTSS